MDGDDVGAADDGETERALLFGFDECGLGGGAWRAGLLGLALDGAELFTVGEDEVLMLHWGQSQSSWPDVKV